MISQKKIAAAQQISSAELHKIKELKDEIFYLQQKLEAASSENHILKQLHYRHSKVIGRYKNSESNVPGLLAGHCNEVRDLRNLLKISQQDERNTSRKLRNVEVELLKTKDALQALHELSEEKGLAEREELAHRLSVLTEKMEVNNKRIQSLEKQLKLNNSTFSRQLANENKKAAEAGIITKNLKMEINSLHQKIKEKDRQLCVKNIYANQLPKMPKDKGDSEPPEKGLRMNRSVQVDKGSFRCLLLAQFQTQETEKGPVQLTKENKSSEDKNEKAKANGAYTDTQSRTEKQSTKKIPKPEPLNTTCRECLRDRRLLREEYTGLEFRKEEEDTCLLKQELKKTMKTERVPLSGGVKENHHEEDAVGAHVKERKKPGEQLNSSEKAGSSCLTPGPKNHTPVMLDPDHTLSEATETLHHGLPPAGTKPQKGSLHHHRYAGLDWGETAESKEKNSSGVYEPSFGKVTKTRQKDGSTEAEAHLTLAEMSLMKELFGPGCV
ncbi:lebercilin-like protein [Porphyrio hochstetteri]